MDAELLAGNIVAHWVQAGALATSALIAIKLLHLNEPPARLAALHVTLVAIVLLPLVQPWRSDEPALQVSPTATAVEVSTVVSGAVAAGELGMRSWLSPARVAVAIVVAGIVMRLSWLFYGIVALARFSRRASDISTPAAAGELEGDLQVSPRYIQQTGARGPWTFGFLRPTVALPAGFHALIPAFQRAVICHELIHVKRRDIAVAYVEELAMAALWFHPWIWLLRARIRVAREQVVDRLVVAMLDNRDEYVRCLVDISGHDLAPHFSQAGAGMLRPRELRARVDAIFQEARMSRRHLVFATIALMMAVGAATSIAAAALPMRSPAERRPSVPEARAVAQAPGATASSKLDPATNRPLAIQFKDARLGAVLDFLGFATSVVFTGYDASFDEGQSVTIEAEAPLEELLDRLLTPTGLTYSVTGPRTIAIARNPPAQVRQAMATRESERRQINTVYPEYPQDALERGIHGTVVVDITVNAAGDVTTAAVASGPQELRASAFKAALGLKYTKNPSTTAMKITFEYTLTGTSWGVRMIGDGMSSVGQRFTVTRSGDYMVKVPSQGPDAPGAVRVGGNVQPPKKLKDVPPVYPQGAQEARVQGVVIIETRIDESGGVSETRVLRSIPLLDEAATAAVKQWQYEPTLMNGVAVPVIMTVTVNFTLTPMVQLRISMPDGTSVDLRVRPNGGMGRIEHPAMSRYGFGPFLDDDPSVEMVKVTLYELGESGLPPRTLANVELKPGGEIVYSGTSPSLGIQLIGVTR